MVQAWREPDPDQDPVDLVRQSQVPPGYLHVLDAYDGEDRPVSLVHEDSDPLRRMAVFDVVVNNADRKGGHVLAMPDGHRFGVDHGVSFHVDDKLRTVLWGWAGKPVDDETLEDVARLRDRLRNGLADQLRDHITAREIAALHARTVALLEDPVMPTPDRRRPIPWPAF
jgi:uncharacterized repeat protein (TIGR03843 family)